jgi:hypothetical protein
MREMRPMDLLAEVAKMAGLGVGGAVALAGFVYFFKESFAAALSRSVNRDLELLKSDLTEKLEHVKHQLEREAHKAALVQTKRHDAYAEAMEHLWRAHAAVETVVTRKDVRVLPPGSLREPADLVAAAEEMLTFKALHFGDETLRMARHAAGELRTVLRVNLLSNRRSIPSGTSAKAVIALAKATESLKAVEQAMREELRPGTDVPV